MPDEMSLPRAASTEARAGRSTTATRRLPERFYARLGADAVTAPQLIKLNRPLALQLGLDPEMLASPEGVADRWPATACPKAPSRSRWPMPATSSATSCRNSATAARILLGEVVDITGARRDIQLKGSGPTPFSRRGDGRAALGPVLREYIVSEAMHALGIPTTRSLAAVTTGEQVYRETRCPAPC